MEETIITFVRCIKFFELGAFITGLIFFRKFKNSYVRYFIFYLGVLIFCETIAYFLNEAKMYEPKNALYDFIVLPLEFLFFHWFYYQSFSNRGRLIVALCSILYIISWVIDQMFFVNAKTVFMSLSYSAGNVTLLILIFTYFNQMIATNEILYFKTDIKFWVSLGILVFYLGTFPYFGLRNVLIKQYNPLFRSYTWGMIFLDYIMYCLFAIGFAKHQFKAPENDTK